MSSVWLQRFYYVFGFLALVYSHSKYSHTQFGATTLNLALLDWLFLLW